MTVKSTASWDVTELHGVISQKTIFFVQELFPICNKWVPGALSPGVKQMGREADHSPPTSAEIKNGGAIPPFSHMSSWRSA
jgi:hypothetical protein